MTPESDIDILTLGDRQPDLKALKETGSLLNREVSVKYMSEKQFSSGLDNRDPLVAEVVANHITLKGIDNICNMLWRNYAKQQEIPAMVL
jgi:predicted XRE-type DNA-binding protein